MLYIIVGLLGGVICSLIAPTKRRNILGWFVIGFLMPVIGIILLLVLPTEPDPYAAPNDLIPEPGPAQLAQQAEAQRQNAQDRSLEALQKLVELKDQGAVTQAEFDAKKQQLLEQI